MVDINDKDILETADTTKRLIQDDEYYRYIFKKTERIVSVVFYILYNTAEEHRTEMHIEDIKHAARQVHDTILQSLETRVHAAEDAVRVTALALIGLESKIQVAHVAGVFTAEIVQVLRSEIDTVLRGLNRYMKREPVILDTARPAEPRQRQPRERRSERPATSAASMSMGETNRRDRIIAVLKAQGPVSIKDISRNVTDVSEKTIQRELNALIEDNVIQRQGERRWSMYSVVSASN